MKGKEYTRRVKKYIQCARVEWSEWVVEDGDEDEIDLEDGGQRTNQCSSFIPFPSFFSFHGLCLQLCLWSVRTDSLCCPTISIIWDVSFFRLYDRINVSPCQMG